MTRVKICGLTRDEDVRQAVAAGADAVGFILVPGSARELSPAALPALAAAGRGALRVAVLRDLPLEAALPLAVHVDALQLHGEEDAGVLAAYRAALPATVQLWKAIRVTGPDSLRSAAALTPWLDALVLDSGGGTGAPFDWELARGYAPGVPWWLAGGLHAGNVGTAIMRLQPHGVDVAGGVEAAPGLKDPARLVDFLYKVRTLR